MHFNLVVDNSFLHGLHFPVCKRAPGPFKWPEPVVFQPVLAPDDLYDINA